MKDSDWKDAVDFGYAIYFKAYCHVCYRVLGYLTCAEARPRMYCQDCLMKIVGGLPPIERYEKGPKKIYEQLKKEGKLDDAVS